MRLIKYIEEGSMKGSAPVNPKTPAEKKRVSKSTKNIKLPKALPKPDPIDDFEKDLSKRVNKFLIRKNLGKGRII